MTTDRRTTRPAAPRGRFDNGVGKGKAITQLIVGAFAFVVGLNDGSPLVAHAAAAGTTHAARRVATLAISLAVLPALVGTAVAHTYAAGVVELRAEPIGRAVAVTAVVVATVVVVALHRAHRPTSLTLALIGALAGGAAGAGLGVHWDGVARVVVLGLVAPTLAVVLGFGLSRSLGLLNGRARAGAALSVVDRLGFVLQSAAYSLNDGQKVLLVPLVLLGTSAVSGAATMLAVAAGFAAGTAGGLVRARRAASVQVVPAHARHLVAAELVSALVGMGGAALGAPLSMSQACAAANVGSGAADGFARVRWSVAGSLAMAWAVTVPAAALVALLAARLLVAL